MRKNLMELMRQHPILKRVVVFLFAMGSLAGFGILTSSSASASTFVWSSVKKCYWDVYTPNQYVNVQVRLHTRDDGARHIDAVSWSGDDAVGMFQVQELNSAGTLIDSVTKDVNATSYTYYFSESELAFFNSTSVLKARVKMNLQGGNEACFDTPLGGSYGVTWTYSN